MEEIYTWEDVVAYSIIALNNLINSANEIDLKNLKMIIEPLKTIHTKIDVVEYSNLLLSRNNNT